MTGIKRTGMVVQERDRHLCTVGSQLIAALSASHSVDFASPVKLRAALPQPEQRPVAQNEADVTGIALRPKFLYGPIRLILNADGDRVDRYCDGQIAALHSLPFGLSSQACDRFAPFLLDERPVR